MGADTWVRAFMDPEHWYPWVQFKHCVALESPVRVEKVPGGQGVGALELKGQ